MEIPSQPDRVLVACPDARPPAYQAVIGLNIGVIDPPARGYSDRE
jgi:hypothetical protein